MATNYPSSLDSFTNPTATDTLDSATVPHAAQHDNINDAVTAIETALGANLANVVLPARSISTTAPLTGGGDLSASRTLSLNIGSSLTTSTSNLIVDSTVVPYLANANTFTASPQQITVNAAGNKGLIIKGAPSQTNNLQEWQNSGGTAGAFVDPYGSLYLAQIGSRGGTGAYFGLANADAITVNTNANTNKGLIVKGAASQSADLQQWQNSSGTVLGGVNAAGQIYAGTTASGVGSATTALTSAAYTSATVAVFTYGGTSLVQAGQRVTVAGVTGGTYNGTWTVSTVTSTTFTVLGSGFTNVAGSGGTFKLSAVASIVTPTAATPGLVIQRGSSSQTTNLLEIQDETGGYIVRYNQFGNLTHNGSAVFQNSMIVIANVSTNIGLTVKGAASQTADLQEWQNSAGTVLTSVTSAGTINFASGNTSATATAGSVTAPALVAGYITMQIAGTTVKVPYYSN